MMTDSDVNERVLHLPIPAPRGEAATFPSPVDYLLEGSETLGTNRLGSDGQRSPPETVLTGSLKRAVAGRPGVMSGIEFPRRRASSDAVFSAPLVPDSAAEARAGQPMDGSEPTGHELTSRERAKAEEARALQVSNSPPESRELRDNVETPDRPLEQQRQRGLQISDGRSPTVLYPRPARRSRLGGRLSFLICVVLPTVLVGLYYYFIAKDVYASEFRFSVVEQTPVLPAAQTPPSNTMTGGGATSLLTVASAISGGGGAGSGSIQNFIVTDYVNSPGAYRAVDSVLDLQSMFKKGEPTYFDKYFRRLFSYSPADLWSQLVNANYDPVTSLASVKVSAYAPQDSMTIATALLHLSEKLVNDIAARSNNDVLKAAEQQVDFARKRVTTAANALAAYRGKSQVVDPSSSIVQSNNALVATLQANISQLETQAKALTDQGLPSTAVMPKLLAAQIAASQAQLKKVEANVGGTKDGSDIAASVGSYEAADLERQYANSAYVAAQVAVDQARANAGAQHIYLTPYSEPTLPVSPAGPQRLMMVIATFLGLVMAWTSLRLIVRTISGAHV